MKDQGEEIVIYRLPKVMEITGLCRSDIYNKLAAGEFIKPIRLGRRSIGFRSDELKKWILSRPRAEIKAA